ncbi:MAG: hypothetical protein AABZ60_25070 [Planctomycetota bacterium]
MKISLLLTLIFSTTSFLLAQSPQDKLLARRAAGIDGYRNLAVEIQKFFRGLCPEAGVGYFTDLQIRGAQRTSFNYTAEGCVVEMALAPEYILETLQSAAGNAGVPFTEEHLSQAKVFFTNGLKVQGFGRYRGAAHLKENTPVLPKEEPIKKPVEEYRFVPPSEKQPLRQRQNIEEMENELDMFVETERETPLPPRSYRSGRSEQRNLRIRGPIRIYEWEEHHSAETPEELDMIIDRAIEEALKHWGKRDRSSRSGWKRIRSYTDPSGNNVEEFIRETESPTVE